MLRKLYADWMFRWETDLTTRDENRIVRPVEWGFDWLAEYAAPAFLATEHPALPATPASPVSPEEREMLRINQEIIADSDHFYGYIQPTDYRLETRHPQLFPTNVRPETLAQDADLKARAAAGKLPPAEFLRFSSPIRTPHPENDLVNARWYPAAPEKLAGRHAKTGRRPAMIVMPQWNADAFSHNALCTLFNRFGISALRLSKPYHDIRRPAELERSDYAVSSNIVPHRSRLPPGGRRHPLLPRLARVPGLRPVRRARNLAWQLLRLHRRRA